MSTSNPQQSNATQQKPKPQKEMTKAERRELQERQRAAKAQAQQASGKTKGNIPKASKETTPARPQKSVSRLQEPMTPRTSRMVQDTSDTTARTVGGRTQKSQIFAHFGAPKHAPAVIKGDIHPAIISLGQKFGAFKITGANARCVATLTAFKKVSCSLFPLLC
jgi:translation initiation factor eIF-2B subunit delta